MNLDTFMRALLSTLGLPATPGRMEFLARWAAGENTGARFNPLATTLGNPAWEDPADPHWNTFDEDRPWGPLHVRNYRDLASGVQATAATMRQPNFAAILQSLTEERVVPGLADAMRTWGTMPFVAQLRDGWRPAEWDVRPALEFTQMPAAGPITARFGETITVGGVERVHRGVDIGCPVGTPVYAPAAGRVVPFTNDGSFGVGVCLDHVGTPWYSLYAHLSRADVAVGQDVREGQQIGLSGNTGLTTGPHLHWQVCKSNAFPTDISFSADPLTFLVAAPPAPPTAPLEARVASLERWQGELNEALVSTRWPLIALALDADLPKVQRALDLLRREGVLR